jgi:hypothetical protein
MIMQTRGIIVFPDAQSCVQEEIYTNFNTGIVMRLQMRHAVFSNAAGRTAGAATRNLLSAVWGCLGDLALQLETGFRARLTSK